MSKKYNAEQYVLITTSGSEAEIEFKMVVDFTGHPGSPATMIDPPEGPIAEVDQVQFFRVKNGKALSEPTSIPDWMVESLTSGQDFIDWMLVEACEQSSVAADEYADYKRDMMMSDR